MRRPHSWVWQSSQNGKSAANSWASPGPTTSTPETDLSGCIRHESLSVTPISSGPQRVEERPLAASCQPQ